MMTVFAGGSRLPDQAAERRTWTLLPVASAKRSSVLVLGNVCPLSNRAMADWLVPIRAANSACDSPARNRALTNSAEIFKFGGERVVLGLHLGVGQQASPELREWNGHVISFARCGASSISARGAFWVFFMNARRTTTLRPIAVT
jgi:hypothetical protein